MKHLKRGLLVTGMTAVLCTALSAAALLSIHGRGSAYAANSGQTTKPVQTSGSTPAVGVGLPIVGSADNFNKLMQKIAESQKNNDLYPPSSTGPMIEDIGQPLVEGQGGQEASRAVPAPSALQVQSTNGAIHGSGGGGGGRPNDYSATNIQVAGVDEADIIKTDGQYIYHLTNAELNIVQADSHGKMRLMHTINFNVSGAGFYPQDMYIDGDRLCLIGYTTDYRPWGPLQSTVQPTASAPAIKNIYSKTFVTVQVYDLHNKTAPVMTREFSAEGNLLASRKVDHMLYLVLNNYLDFYHVTNPADAIPLYLDSASPTRSSYRPLDYATMRYFPGDESNSMLIICGLDITGDKAEAQTESIIGSGDTVYMSTAALYIAKYNYVYDLSPGPLPRSPKLNDQTTFYKFVLANGVLGYGSQGAAPGNVLNQYSMDEYNGCFRVATTVNSANGDMKNALTVFDQSMQVIGKIENIAPGEKVYAARFIGDRAFMVTYRTVDPLFGLDLSDPHHPKVAGELKIPGYSTYLHPYDENHLIGFGRDTEELKTIDSKGNVVSTRVVNRGLKLALFDISELTNPKVLSVVSIGDANTYSELLDNPKAMLFSKAKGFIAFPVTQSPYFTDTGKEAGEAFAGAYVYNISLKGITLRGTISPTAENGANDQYSVYDNYIQRIIYINDTFYAASNLGIQANDMKSLQYLSGLQYNQS